MKMVVLPKAELFFPTQNYSDIFFAAVLSIVVSILLSKALRRVSNEKSGIPGRLGLPFLGESISFLSATNSTKGVYDFVRLRRLWHGKWFKTRMFGKTHVFIPSTEGAKAVLANDFTLFKKGLVKSLAYALGKKSMLCVPEEGHRRIRRLLSDPFSQNSLSKFVQKFDYMLWERLKPLADNGKSFALLDFSMNITFDAMCNMLLSITDASMLKQIETECKAISAAMLAFPVMIPGTSYYNGIKARNRLMKTFEAMISRRRSGKDSADDFLQTMLERDSLPANEKLDDSEIMDNLLTFIIAGHGTTAAAIMWSIKFLDENKDVQDRLREEQLSILENKPDRYLLTLEDLNNMPYATKVAKETLRMSNVVMWYPRAALEDCTIEGYEIKKGWHVNVDATCIHYDPALHKDPMKFNPSRFDEIQKPYSYLPFGAGPRTCLGINMAKAMMYVFLHRLTSAYKWTVDDLDPSLERKSTTPRLRSGCPITLTALKDHK